MVHSTAPLYTLKMEKDKKEKARKQQHLSDEKTRWFVVGIGFYLARDPALWVCPSLGSLIWAMQGNQPEFQGEVNIRTKDPSIIC